MITNFKITGKDSVSKVLQHLGYAHVTSSHKDAITAFQLFSGLSPTGIWSNIETDKLYSRFCSCPDIILGASSNDPHWDEVRLKVWNNIDAFKREEGDLYLLAAMEWSKYCGLTFEDVADQADADLWATMSRIDTAGRTLAWQQLPFPHAKSGEFRSEGRYDSADLNFYRDIRNALKVIMHEDGHGIGLRHFNGCDVMNPSIVNTSLVPCQSVIDYLVRHYGKPEEGDNGDNGDNGGDDDNRLETILFLDGQKYEGFLAKSN